MYKFNICVKFKILATYPLCNLSEFLHNQRDKAKIEKCCVSALSADPI